MFTGIVEKIGTVNRVDKRGSFAILNISCADITDDLKIGDSVAVNGACLTATKVEKGSFTADISYETLGKSSLEYLKPGDYVNLERALTLSSRLGGHIVSGHVDCLGKFTEIRKESSAYRLCIGYPENIEKYVVSKGSIALDGISLTIADVFDNNEFTVAVIPHTFENTILKYRHPGDFVNIEADMVARYMEKLLKNEKKADRLKSGILKMQQMEDFI